MRRNLDIINLDRTNPSYSSPKIVLQTVEKLLNKCNFTSYSEPEGLFELRKAISSKLRSINHVDISPDQIILKRTQPFDIDKAKNVLEYRPKYDIKSGLADYIKILKKYQKA